MPDEPEGYTTEEHSQHLEERKSLVDAARESARTFDQAVLAFGSAAFGASIAFVKDVAPHPQHDTLMWLGVAWGCFSIGLLFIVLSFLLSHKACMFEVYEGARTLGKPTLKRKRNWAADLTDWCNYLCVACLFVGLVSWLVFAFENLATGR
jgi:hypothetical protein